MKITVDATDRLTLHFTPHKSGHRVTLVEHSNGVPYGVQSCTLDRFIEILSDVQGSAK